MEQSQPLPVSEKRLRSLAKFCLVAGIVFAVLLVLGLLAIVVATIVSGLGANMSFSDLSAPKITFFAASAFLFIVLWIILAAFADLLHAVMERGK